MALITLNVAHLVTDALGADGDHCQPGCEEQDDDCGPLCADCSCTHAGRPALSPAVLVTCDAASPRELAVVLRVAPPPPNPHIDGVFHPPKA